MNKFNREFACAYGSYFVWVGNRRSRRVVIFSSGKLKNIRRRKRKKGEERREEEGACMCVCVYV